MTKPIKPTLYLEEKEVEALIKYEDKYMRRGNWSDLIVKILKDFIRDNNLKQEETNGN